MSDEIADVFDTAADIIEQRGWTQHTSVDSTGARCALGALTLAAIRVTPQADQRTWSTARVTLRQQVGGPVSEWNDEPGRTQQEVLDVLRLAAKQERMAGDAA